MDTPVKLYPVQQQQDMPQQCHGYWRFRWLLKFMLLLLLLLSLLLIVWVPVAMVQFSTQGHKDARTQKDSGFNATAPAMVAPATAPATVAPATATATVAPATVAPTAAPATVAPATVAPATAPATVESATAPATVESATAPATVESATAPATVESATATATPTATRLNRFAAWQMHPTPVQLPAIGFSTSAPPTSTAHAVGVPYVQATDQAQATMVVPPPTYVLPGTIHYIPILMYHYVRLVDQSLDPLGYNLSVTPEQFAAQLEWLAREGYTTLRMDEVVACLDGRQSCPARAVALTFDDGYMDAYTMALPVLQQYGFVATFYVVSGFVGHAGYMGWEEVRLLHEAGMEIGSHSVTHPDLTGLSYEQARYQIVISREQLAGALGTSITSFCYPGGKVDARVAGLVQQAGYTSATTTMHSYHQYDYYQLPRVRVSGGLDQSGFAWLLMGGR